MKRRTTAKPKRAIPRPSEIASSSRRSSLNGILLVDKPAGPTSHDIVAHVRRASGERRCGHTGTLDPFATGLLVLCLGRSTRFARFLSGTSKTYFASIRFGYATDSYDRTGSPVGEARTVDPDNAELVRLLEAMRGKSLQVPPAISAKKVGGKRAYTLARTGAPVILSPVEVEVHHIELKKVDGPVAEVEMSVSSGTYVRALAHDLGQKMGIGAHLAELRRTTVASLSVEDAISMDDLGKDAIEGALLSGNEALQHVPEARLAGEAAHRLRHGRSPGWEEISTTETIDRTEGFVRMLDERGELIAIGEASPSGIRPLVVWETAKSH